MMRHSITRRDLLIAGGSTVFGAFLESRLGLINRGIDGAGSFLDGYFNRDRPAYVGQEIVDQSIEMDKADISVHDGDTIRYRGIKFRFAGVDTAEEENNTWPDQHGLGEFSGHNCADAGRDYVINAIKNASGVSYVEAGTEKYGRGLVYVLIDGELLQYHLVNGGHAYETVSHFGDNGWPKLAKMILDISAHPKEQPHFQRPHLWKKQFEIRDD